MAGRPKRTALDVFRDAETLLSQDEQEVGFVSSIFAQLGLPYRNPGDDVPVWIRRNGDLELHVRPDMDSLPGGKTKARYPYGSMPRLLVAWLSTEAVRTKSPELRMGDSLSDFMRTLDLQITGGERGTITRLRDQMVRLFTAVLQVKLVGNATRPQPDRSRSAGASLIVADKYDLWLSSRAPDQMELMPSTVLLSQQFFDEVIKHPVPVDVGALRILRGSPLRLDIYTWLTWRMFTLKRPTVVPWHALKGQFGSNLADTPQGRAQFRRDFNGHLKQVLMVYREAKVDVTPAGLELRPSPTHVLPAAVKRFSLGA